MDKRLEPSSITMLARELEEVQELLLEAYNQQVLETSNYLILSASDKLHSIGLRLATMTMELDKSKGVTHE